MILKTALLPHQQAAVDKLIGIRVGALYMEMGTGKTRTALEMAARRLSAGKIKHVLWLCPCSVRQSLREDIAKHADGALASIAVYGIESLSSSVRLFELLEKYVEAAPTMLVVDESNLVKNPRAIRTERITRLAAKCPYRVILNGTPISRSEADLFAQWYLLDWRILGYRSFYSFAANHLEYDPEIPGKVHRVLNTDYLTEKIAPYSYQVSKEECFHLEKKLYRQVRSHLSSGQSDHYFEVTDAMIAQLDERNPETIYRMLSAAQAVISGLYVEDNGKHFRTRPMFEDPHDNPRICDLLDLVGQIPATDKVIIFAKYTHEINAILSVLNENGRQAVPFYGSVSRRERQASLEAFRTDARFLVANKVCAGYGLNLQYCHRIIYYSNDWDWATRAQSEDRVHRLGQTEQVEIIDIVARGTLDERIMKCLARKERLEDCIKRELAGANDQKEARGKFKKWLKGELNG